MYCFPEPVWMQSVCPQSVQGAGAVNPRFSALKGGRRPGRKMGAGEECRASSNLENQGAISSGWRMRAIQCNRCQAVPSVAGEGSSRIAQEPSLAARGATELAVRGLGAGGRESNK